MNKVQLIGYLGKNPEMSYTPNGKAVVKVSIATSERWTGTNGEKQERTEWTTLEAWGKLAETMNQYLHKGSHVYVEGSLKTDKYEKDGVTKYFTKVVVSNFEFLDKKDASNDVSAETSEDTAAPETPVSEDDSPF